MNKEKSNKGMKKKSFFIFVFLITTSLNADFTKEKGMLIDNETKLEWQDEYSHGEIKRSTWIEAINYCENDLNLNGIGWRLPNIRELSLILEDTNINNAFDFIAHDVYWSSTTNSANSKKAFIVDSNSGSISDYGTKSSSLIYVRCVRDIN